MLFNNTNQPFGTIKNPMIKSLFIQQFEEGGFNFPPGTSYIVTDPDGDNFIVTEDGNRMITE